MNRPAWARLTLCDLVRKRVESQAEMTKELRNTLRDSKNRKREGMDSEEGRY